MNETRREMALRHVRTGRKIIIAQRASIEYLRAKGEDTTRAEQLLAHYERCQAIFADELSACASGVQSDRSHDLDDAERDAAIAAAGDAGLDPDDD
jgi:hypothetical protein